MLQLDQHGRTPLGCAFECFGPNATEFIRVPLYDTVEEKLQRLGLAAWQSGILKVIDEFQADNINNLQDRKNYVTEIFLLLRSHELKEDTSLLELAVWKHKIVLDGNELFHDKRAQKRRKVSDDGSNTTVVVMANDTTSRPTVDRQNCYLHSPVLSPLQP